MRKLLQNWNRRVWLAIWAQGRRRARKYRLLPAPLLKPKFPSLAVWEWPYANPYRWNVYNSLDEGLTYQFFAWQAGYERQHAPDGNELMFIVGVDVNGTEITHRSNAIHPEDALYPAPVLQAQYPSLAVWEWPYANPYRWNVYNSLDEGVTFQFFAWQAGYERQHAPDGNELMFIVGVNATGVEITERSNAIHPEDAVAPPTAPSNLIAMGDAAWVLLGWQDNSNNETGFRLYRKPFSDPFTVLADVPADTTSFEDWTAELGITYTYYVVAVNEAGESAQSNHAVSGLAGA